jgi:uncharacterized membrane protein
MTPQTDPVWPWSVLRDGLAAAPAAVTAAVWLAGLLAFALPLVSLRLPPGRRGRSAAAGGVLLLFLLAFVALYFEWDTFFGLTGPGGVVLGRLGGAGLALLLVVPLGLAGLTLRTYLAAGAPRRRAFAVLALRAAAFAIALLAVLRPSLGFSGSRDAAGGTLLIVVDHSKSMSIQDESGRSRWDYLLQTLHDAEPALERLRQRRQVQVEFYRFDVDAGPFSPQAPGAPDGKRTDVGGMLRRLNELNAGRRLRGLLVLSDGRNTEAHGPDPVAEARRWRRLNCPVHTFLYGNPATPSGQRDVAVTVVTATPPAVPVKGKITVRATIDAPGFVNSTAHVHLLLDGQEATSRDLTLTKIKGNQVTLEGYAPDKAGEVKVEVRVEPLPGELNPDNNQSGTFVTVIKGGVNVLLVDKPRYPEPQLLYDALHHDARLTVKTVWLRGTRPLDPNAPQLFDFEKQKYDVIIFGDVTPEQVRAVRASALAEVKEQVSRGAGFLMIGGQKSFIGAWKDTEIAALLPVELGGGQVEDDGPQEVKMKPTEPGLRLYSRVLRLSDGERDAEAAAWAALPTLKGANRLTLPANRTNEVVLAESEEKDPKTRQPYPLLVTKDYGGGRVLAFAGDTTSRWMNNDEGVRKHDRFWRQMVLWLAHQDETASEVWVRPDVRNVAAGGDVGFSVGMRSKGGLEVKNGAYEAEVVGPDGVAHAVRIAPEGGEDRGTFRPEEAGEYTIRVKAHGKDAEGEEVGGESAARFLAYEADVEMAEWAADDKLMDQVAREGRGQFQRGSKLAAFLEELPAPPEPARAKAASLPDWRTNSFSPFFPAFFLLFAGVLAGEWFLRRRWGMV